MRPTPAVDLYWIPLGAGAHVVRWAGAVYERWRAAREQRPVLQMYHTALVVHLPSGDIVVEQTPASRHGEERGVVATGPVGTALMAFWPLPRYEVRCWSGGRIDDLDHVSDGPVRISEDEGTALRIIRSASDVPTLTWGRDAVGIGEMWNSNSVVAWILHSSCLDASIIQPPPGGAAPGWRAGWVRAERADDLGGGRDMT